MKKVLCISLLLFAIVFLGARTYMVGGQFYSLSFDTSDSTSTFTDGSSKLWFYKDKQFYFNSNNRANDRVDYDGSCGLFVTTASDTIDSNSVVIWMTDYQGKRVDTDSLDLISSETIYPGDTLFYQISDSTFFNCLWGIKVRTKHQATAATDKDSTWVMQLGVVIK